jgi:uncharacterized protein YgbK (DUF1537 family)
MRVAQPWTPELQWNLPGPWAGPLPTTKAVRRALVVLDDDPTGTQTVRNVPVLTRWESSHLTRVLERGTDVIYVSTNLRALTQGEAARRMEEVLASITEARHQSRRDLDVISRSDSTLRGHFPLDCDAMARQLTAWGEPVGPCLLVPAFPEGGRYTVYGTQWVAVDGEVVPAGETVYAHDATFGYRSSRLDAWVEEKTGGRVSATAVLLLDIDRIRRGGPTAVAEFLIGASGYVVVDAVSAHDLDVVSAGIDLVEARGIRVIARTAAGYVRARSGMSPPSLLRREELPVTSRAGLWVVGSHVKTTTEQLRVLTAAHPELAVVEVPSRILIDGDADVVQQVARVLSDTMARGLPAAVVTERTLVTSSDPEASLRLSRRISETLSAIVAHVTIRPGYVVSKGGITSWDVAVKGLSVTEAFVLGQVLPGVPVWVGRDGRWRDLAQIVFPGNVGDKDALARLYTILDRRQHDGKDCGS